MNIFQLFLTLYNLFLYSSDIVKCDLAACVNLIPSITSVYKWQDEVMEDSETLMVKYTIKLMNKNKFPFYIISKVFNFEFTSMNN